MGAVNPPLQTDIAGGLLELHTVPVDASDRGVDEFVDEHFEDLRDEVKVGRDVNPCGEIVTAWVHDTTVVKADSTDSLGILSSICVG
jgi:hypothetical protein